ncbi:MAG TPA: putative manganese-dependent inorganic diphosphatase [Candidatus Onthocola gallistercoris]|uniref:inorganic diphosphatase n=1 Tax=Candidatus Onthocola gallistercoris TaxID=2840876 RepID=A0A9D1KVZ0_9FIRM|nr:putative manganese-dependent inorganic diphosphatase [Candidatus Onthocola gallistercoris]
MTNKKIYVIGHKNPDTDSICSAISYAYLRNKMTGDNYVPARAGRIPSEAKFVLDYFKADRPIYVEDVRAQVRDMNLNPPCCASPETSLKDAWNLLLDQKRSTLCVVDEDQKLLGLITKGDITKTYMGVYDSKILSQTRTPYKNILETLNGEMLVGDPDGVVEHGKVLIAAANPDLMEEYVENGDMVMVENRYESQLCAIEMNAGCLIVCMNGEIQPGILKLAQERGCSIIRTAYDTYIAARLLNQSIALKHFMVKDNLLTFKLDDYIDYVKEIMVNNRHRSFPIVSLDGKVLGMFSRQMLVDIQKKRVALVDHNEASQAVDGIRDCDLLEIVDHHKLGYVETLTPVFFRNQPVGCTSTIIYMMFQEHQIRIPKKIAGLMCSAILSDTLLFHSPTCTPLDRKAVEELAKIAGIDPQTYAMQMFSAGSDLQNKSDAEVFYQDFKKFSAGDIQFGVGQIMSLDPGELDRVKERLITFLPKAKQDHGLDMIFFMLTDILEESTFVLCSDEEALAVARRSFAVEGQEQDNGMYVRKMVSRKKQFIPKIVDTLQEQ